MNGVSLGIYTLLTSKCLLLGAKGRLYATFVCSVMLYGSEKLQVFKVMWSDQREMMPGWSEGLATIKKDTRVLLRNFWVDCNWISWGNTYRIKTTINNLVSWKEC